MTYDDLMDLFQSTATTILATNILNPDATPIITNPDKFIRKQYPRKGAPDWKITDNIVFLNPSEQPDEYGRMPQTEYQSENGTVMAYRTRTRVWQVLFTAYGPKAYEMSNQLRDGYISEVITRTLELSKVFLIPAWPNCVQANEQWAGQWWQRFDLTLSFNEEYITSEDVGHIDAIPLHMDLQRRTK